MKYKVGDKVRISENLYFQPMIKAGEVVEIIEVKDDNGSEYYYMHKLPDVGISEEFISHRAISQITDSDISEFKREKIAWYFDDKYSYHKALQILEKEGITFNEKNECKEYFDIYEKFGIAYHGGFGFGDLEYFKSKGYEIIEIMNPFRIRKYPPKLKGLNTHYSMITALQEEIEIMQKEIDRLSEIIEKQKRIVKMTGNGLMELSKVLIEKQEEIK